MSLKNILLTAVAGVVAFATNAQLDCSGGRYTQPIFGFTKTGNAVTYGSNTDLNGNNQTLTLDVYEPTNDQLAQRPLIIFVHGGTFISGSKDDGDVVELCKRFAKLGYVTATINYRLGMGLPPNQQTASAALLRAVEDMKAAVRFFRKDAATTNTYRVDPNYIIGGGSSAGALTALHLAYLDQDAEVPAFVDTVGHNKLEGYSGNPGYNSEIRAVVNLCGALADSSWIVSGDEPVVSVHGDQDATVPYDTDVISVGGLFPILPVSGSRDVHARAVHQGVSTFLKTFPGQDHVPYVLGGSSGAAYMDSTYWVVRDFLAWVVGCQAFPTDVNEQQNVVGKLNVFPNPANTDINIAIAGQNLKNSTIELFDISGRLVYYTKIVNDITNHKISAANLSSGLYVVKVQSPKGTQTRKLIIQ